MKRSFSILLLLSILIFQSCETRDAKAPEEVLSDFFQALGDNNIDKARKLSTPDSEMFLSKIEEASKGSENTVGGLYDNSQMQFGEAIIKDDMATVPVTEVNSGEVIKYKLRKIDGQWRVAFDKATLINAGEETLDLPDFDSENTTDQNASDTSVIKKNEARSKKQLDKMNMDSLKKVMQQELDL